MKLKNAVSEVNKDLITLLKHDHWEVRLGFDLVSQGLLNIYSGLKYWGGWFIALLAILLIPILYPIAVVIRILKK